MYSSGHQEVIEHLPKRKLPANLAPPRTHIPVKEIMGFLLYFSGTKLLKWGCGGGRAGMQEFRTRRAKERQNPKRPSVSCKPAVSLGVCLLILDRTRVVTFTREAAPRRRDSREGGTSWPCLSEHTQQQASIIPPTNSEPQPGVTASPTLIPHI